MSDYSPENTETAPFTLTPEQIYEGIAKATAEVCLAFPYYAESNTNRSCALYKSTLREIERRTPVTNTDRQNLYDIATKGALSGKKLAKPNLAYWGGQDHNLEMRWQLMRLYGVNQEFAQVITEQQIVANHGSSIASLPTTLKHGLLPQSQLRKLDIPILGEMSGSASISEDHVSFTHWNYVDLSLRYAANGQPLKRDDLLSQIDQLNEQLRNPGKYYRQEAARVILEQLKSLVSFYDKPNKTGEEELRMELLIQNEPVIYFLRNRPSGFTEVEYLDRTDETDFYLKGGVKPSELPLVCVPQQRVSMARELIEKAGVEMQVFTTEEWKKTETLKDFQPFLNN